MIIVFFHVLFLLGKYVYKKYHEGSGKNPEITDEKPACTQACEMDKFFDDDDDFGSKSIVFTPPAYLQRYIAVRDVISDPKYKGKIRKIVDFGCAELGLFTHLKQVSSIEEMLFVDIDRRTLQTFKRKIEPFNTDFLNMRNRPLRVSIYEGSVTDNDKLLENTDAVICIELIEHLYPETLRNVPGNIFGFIKPQLALITTPNADFNVLFGRMSGFRHADHKFEWTREEFENWAHDIVSKYPEYQVTFHGISPGPEGTEKYGCCSQMAVFYRYQEYELPRNHGVDSIFKLITHEEYPFKIDNRSDEEKILDDASYYIKKYQINSGNNEMPLYYLAKVMDNENISLEFLQDILENGGFTTTENQENQICVICPPILIDDGPGEDVIDERLNEDAFLSDYDSDDYDPPANYRRPIHNLEENWDDDFEAWSEGIVAAHNEFPDDFISIAMDNEEFNDIIVSNHSRMSSELSDTAPQISSYIETTVSPQESQNLTANMRINTTNNSLELSSRNLGSVSVGNDRGNFTDHKLRFLPDDVSFCENNQPDGTSTPQRIDVSAHAEFLQTATHVESQNSAAQEPLVVEASCESSPNSRSPEMLDSGYPNTYSAPDMTPEYDLPSIAQDSASDSESSSAAKRPRLALAPIVVENGDLANNNRDDEGNNMIPAFNNNLQPLINVLENDIENENDIYPNENGFPAWLLGIQDVEAAAVENDGFDSSSEDENRNQNDEDTDNDNVEDLDEN